MSKKKAFLLISVFILCLYACAVSGQSYKNRLAEGERELGDDFVAASYAFSTHSLQTYKNRFAEGKRIFGDDFRFAEYAAIYAAFYAASTHSLQTYDNRLTEGRELDTGFAEFFYAASTHSLQTYKKKFAEGVREFGDGFEAASYAGSKHFL
jgi:hypothetical protein